MNILTAFRNHHCGLNSSYGYNKYIINKDIVGAIAGAGKVQLHENGFRSEYAQILGLLHPDPERNIIFRSSFEKKLKIKLYQIQNKKYERLAAYYRVPLFSEWENLYEFASQCATPIKVDRNQAIDIGKRTNVFYDLLSGFSLSLSD